MRTKAEIEAELLRLHNHLLDGGDGCIFDICSLAKEAADALATIEGIPLDELEQMVQARSEGWLVVLPCKVGDTVWFIRSAFSMAAFPIEANHVSIRGIDCDGGIHYAAITAYNKTERRFISNDIGKTVFLTREAAEKALGGGQE